VRALITRVSRGWNTIWFDCGKRPLARAGDAATSSAHANTATSERDIRGGA
jgi:hypothetical protein